MQEVGFDLYTQMLNAAVRALRSGREPDLLAPLRVVTEINLHVPALLPTDYVNDVHQRLSMYKRLASADSEDELIERQEELVDRYGKLPDAGEGADRDTSAAADRRKARRQEDRCLDRCDHDPVRSLIRHSIPPS